MKKLSIISSSFGLYLMSALPAFANSHVGGGGTNINPCPPNNSGFRSLCELAFGGNFLGQILTFVFIVAILIALAFLIFGGIKWIISGGDKAGVEGARGMIVGALVGLVIVFLSFFILNIVVQFFTDTTLFNLRLPEL